MLKFLKIIVVVLFGFTLHAQNILTVNSTNDMDDGTCDGVHCSLREAIKAANADPMANIIRFALPGAGPWRIVPGGVFPIMTGDNTFIDAPLATGSEVVIDFSFRVFGGMTFLQINGNDNTIQGLNFTKMNYTSNNDHIIGIGDMTKVADNTLINKCNFFSDATLGAGIDSRSILLTQASHCRISKCIFGADILMSNNIASTTGSILVETTQASNKFTISDNIFVTTKDCIYAKNGEGVIDSNIFGALDTFKFPNFLMPPYAVLLDNGTKYSLNKNFFFNQDINGIFAKNLTGLVEIKDNIFHDIQKDDIVLSGNSNATIGILGNRARSGSTFITASMIGSYALSIIQNDVSDYNFFYGNLLDPSISIAHYQDNTITCIYNQVTALDNTKTAEPNVPSILGINRNSIIGTADPNKLVSVYRNPTGGACPGGAKVCQGGFLHGTTLADGSGNWTLNAPYIGNHTYSAYQYQLGVGNIASEFSPCYRCVAGPIKEFFTADICENSTVSYRGKVYSSAITYDSIGIRGDANICDSVFIVNINVKKSIREVRNVNYCYNQSFILGNVNINKANPIDSSMGQTSLGCDSTVVFIGTERGFNDYKETICSNDSRTFFNETFDKVRTSGVAISPGGATGGCDSTINVQLTIKNFTQNNIVRTLCPGGTLTVGTLTFDATNPSGTVTFLGGSASGCDSVVTISLSFSNPVSSQTYTLCMGDSILIPGTNKYLKSSRPLDTLILPMGSYLNCDSTVYYRINTIPNSIGSVNEIICRTDTFELQGQKFHSGRPQGSILLVNRASNGCDSTIQVSISIRPDAIGTLDTVACEGSFVDIYGTIFDELKPSGTIKRTKFSTFGCDSFINVNVRFIPLKNSIVNPVICRTGSVNIGGQLFNAANPTGSVVIRRSAAQGCDSTVNVSVVIAPSIQASIGIEDLKCNIANTGEVIINSASGTGNLSVSIDGKTPVPYTAGMLFSSLAVGIHNIKITDGIGCDTVIAIQINAGTPLTLTLPNDTTINQGASVLITANTNIIPTTITWDPPSFLSCINCINPTSTPDEDITYTLTLEDQNGCIVKDNITIRVKIEEGDIYVPNVFSPNNDNINESVIPEYRFPDKTRLLVYRVFDRWGALVFERLDGQIGEKIGWDGRFHGEILNPGVYVYAIQYIAKNAEPKWKFGDVTLVR